jgi:hypothetical protein
LSRSGNNISPANQRGLNQGNMVPNHATATAKLLVTTLVIQRTGWAEGKLVQDLPTHRKVVPTK